MPTNATVKRGKVALDVMKVLWYGRHIKKGGTKK